MGSTLLSEQQTDCSLGFCSGNKNISYKISKV